MIDPRFFRSAGPFTLSALAERLGARLAAPAPPDLTITDVATLEDGTATELALFADRRYQGALAGTQAGYILTTDALARHAPQGVRLLLIDSPRLAFAEAAWLFYPDTNEVVGFDDERDQATIGEGRGISSSAIIGAGAVIGPRTRIGAHAVIGAGVIIGADCMVGPNTTIGHAIIGDRVQTLATLTGRAFLLMRDEQLGATTATILLGLALAIVAFSAWAVRGKGDSR